MGRVAVPFGVKGWIKVQVFTETLDSLFDYDSWWLGRDGDWREYRVEQADLHGKGLVAQLEGVADRDAAAALRGLDIAVSRDDLPEADEDEYYWNDLVGLEVVNTEGVRLGRVSGLLETGANDVLVVEGERERLIPFVEHVVVGVDLEAGSIRVEWGADY